MSNRSFRPNNKLTVEEATAYFALISVGCTAILGVHAVVATVLVPLFF